VERENAEMKREVMRRAEGMNEEAQK